MEFREFRIVSNKSGSFIIIVEMSVEYNKAVLEAYQKKKAENRLPPSLKFPTPKTLRELCELVCMERYEERDEMTLKTFFRQGANKETFLQAMAKFDVDKFKPLIKYLNGGINKTDLKNIELLAWLIDFERRPFQFGVDYSLREPVPKVEESEELVAQVTEPGNDGEEPLLVPAARTFNFSISYAILVVMLALVGIGVYWVLPNRPTPSSPPKGWMRWVGDRFQQVPNSENFGDTVALPLDSGVLLHFRRITDTCDITKASIGRIWYAKINGKLEFYNSSGLGFEPVDTLLRLRPLSSYMFSKYVHPCQVGGQISQSPHN